ADVPVKPEPKAKPSDTPKPPAKSDDPFFNPAPAKPDDPFFEPSKTPPADPKPKTPADPKANKAPKHPKDTRDAAIEKALASLAGVLGGDAPAPGKGKGANAKVRVFAGNGQLGDRDFYFLWSLERVGVIFGIDKIGKIDWYEAGAEELLNNQHADGAWGRGA